MKKNIPKKKNLTVKNDSKNFHSSLRRREEKVMLENTSPHPLLRGISLVLGQFKGFTPHRSGAGFTLAELLVTIFIIGLISAFMIVNYRDTGKNGELNMAAQKMVSDIRLAQSFSLGLKEFNCPADLPDFPGGMKFPDGGWGVSFDTTTQNSYFIFADCNGSGLVSADNIFKTVNFQSGVNLSNLSAYDGGGSEIDRINTVFTPPDPKTDIKGYKYHGNKWDDLESEYIRINNTSNTNCKKVMVNKVGLVDFVNTGETQHYCR